MPESGRIGAGDLLRAAESPRRATPNTISWSKCAIVVRSPRGSKSKRPATSLQTETQQTARYTEPPPAEGLRNEKTENAAKEQIVYSNSVKVLPIRAT